MDDRWDYRVVEIDDEGMKIFGVHAVFYTRGKPVSYGVSPATLTWDDGDDGRELLAMLQAAIEKPTLTMQDFSAHRTEVAR